MNHNMSKDLPLYLNPRVWPKMVGLGLVASIIALFIYVPFLSDAVKSTFPVYLRVTEPPPTFQYSNVNESGWKLNHENDDVLHMSTNAHLFVSACRTGEFWQLDKNKTTFEVDKNNHNIFHEVKPFFQRVKSSFGYVCPKKPKCTDLALPKTALLTYPRSGNTWTRHVLEQLTGLPSGAIYDAEVLRSRFLCEGHERGVVVIKTHGPVFLDKIPKNFSYENKYDKLMIILRNPFRSFISHYQLQVLHAHMNHIVKFDVHSTNWDTYIRKSIGHWRDFMKYAIHNSIPKIVFFYEELTTNLFQELLRMSVFLKSDNIENFSFCCALNHQEGSFHKNHTKKEEISDFYSLKQRQMVNEGIDKVIESIRKQHPTIAEYLLTYKS